ncbi:hypothetical protein C8R47DRAFT_1225765 [Mycena vitilis]|nr:hypothetical protein C8R47DRAFT_1225765 [Mycena vitilis]
MARPSHCLSRERASTLWSYGSVVRAIARAINSLVSAVARVIETIVGAVTSVILAIIDAIADTICCRCRSRRSGLRRCGAS